MDRDVKEVVGVLMRVLGDGRTSRAEIEDLGFEAEGDLQVALNEAYVELLEVGCDHDAGIGELATAPCAALQQALDKIVRPAETPTFRAR